MLEPNHEFMLFVVRRDADSGTWSLVPIVNGDHDSAKAPIDIDALGISWLTAPDGYLPEGMRTLFSHLPAGGPVVLRDSAEIKKEVLAGRAGGRPCTDTFPFNIARRKYLVRYFEIEGRPPKEQPGRGTAIDYEVSWHSLGWALDEWQQTVSLEPFAPMATASAQLSYDGRVDQSGSATASDNVQSQSHTAEYADQAMLLAVEATASGWGLNLGLGRAVGASATVPTPLPVTLKAAGALQAGFSFGGGHANSTIRSDVVRRLTTEIGQATQRLRAADTAAGLTVRQGLTDVRRLSATQNPLAKTLNIARFTVNHQWWVRTRQACTTPVILLPIFELDLEFVPDDVFRHRAVLDANLLDPMLHEDLKLAAMEAVPGGLAHIVVQVEWEGQPKAKNGALQLTFGFDDTDGNQVSRERTYPVRVESGNRSRFELPIEPRLARLIGLTMRYNNRARFSLDKNATIRWWKVDWRDSDGTIRALQEFADNITLPANQDVYQGIADGVPKERTTFDVPRSVARIVAHLNAYRSYYRLVIDVARDPVARFLTLPAELANPPTDLTPLGVAGAHLVFASDKTEPVSTEKDQADEDDAVLVSTPTGATVDEVFVGVESVPRDGRRPPQISLPSAGDKGFAWPTPATPTLPAAPAVPSLDGNKPEDPKTTGAAAVTELDPENAATLIKALTEMIQKTFSNLGPSVPDPGAPAGQAANDPTKTGKDGRDAATEKNADAVS
jgi:hypothetical protein